MGATRPLWPLALLFGAVAGLGHAPFGWTEVSFTGLAAALLMMRLRPGFISYFAAGLGYFAASLNWIISPFLIEPETFGWMAPFGLAFMAGGLALFWGMGGVIARRVGGAFGMILGLICAEIIRSYLFGGFAWGTLGQLWLPLNTVQLASLIGPFGLTLLLVAPLALLVSPDKVTRGCGILLLLVGLGLHYVMEPPAPLTTKPAVIRLVQPNFPQEMKWNPDLAEGHLETLIAMSEVTPKADLVIWPETALPWLYYPGDYYWGAIGFRLAAPLLSGAQRVDELHAWNTIFLADQDGQSRVVYDKHHLVPFSETFPLQPLLPYLGLGAYTADEGGSYVKGPGPQVVDLPVLGRTLPLICYESDFPQDTWTVTRPEVIVQLSNDAWFGDFSGPIQHLDQSRLRAIELGLPMVRSANTGISALIDPWGRVVQSLELNTQGILDVRVPPPLPATLYSRTGDLPAVALALLALIIALLWRAKRLTL